MLLELADLLKGNVSALHLFQYLTFRTIMSTLTALAVSLLAGPAMIRKLAEVKAGQVVRSDGPQSHLAKAGTPTMGGALILLAVDRRDALLWADLRNRYVWLVLAVDARVRRDRLLRRLQEAGAEGQPRPRRALEIFLAVGVRARRCAFPLFHGRYAGGDALYLPRITALYCAAVQAGRDAAARRGVFVRSPI